MKPKFSHPTSRVSKIAQTGLGNQRSLHPRDFQIEVFTHLSHFSCVQHVPRINTTVFICVCTNYDVTCYAISANVIKKLSFSNVRKKEMISVNQWLHHTTRESGAVSCNTIQLSSNRLAHACLTAASARPQDSWQARKFDFRNSADSWYWE
jgi:hypothetical protein